MEMFNMKYYKLRIYNWLKYPKSKLTETDFQHIQVMIKYDTATIIGSNEQIKRLRDLASNFKKWYIR